MKVSNTMKGLVMRLLTLILLLLVLGAHGDELHDHYDTTHKTLEHISTKKAEEYRK